jgi:16S rRNA (cytidine1402-2'-O)-methyltransferase
VDQEIGLYLVPTPIGNLSDMTQRAIQTLKEVDLILAEDTRTSGQLLKHFGISTALMSHHAHNEHYTVEKIIEKLKSNTKIALISDAGTPSISDPGYLLVSKAVEAGIVVQCLPGPTAFVPALVVSGFSTDRFVFEGFLPHKKGRNTRIEKLKDQVRTMVFYESPFRIEKTLEQFIEAFGIERRVCLSREISKLYEQHIRGSLGEVLEQVKTSPPKGEIVLVLEGKKDKTSTD